MKREEIEARVAELERFLIECQDDLKEARAELAAMPKEPRRCTIAFCDEGRPRCVWLRSEGIDRWIAKNGGTYCEMIEVMPASEEVLRALQRVSKYSKSSAFGDVCIIARELRARLPTP